MENNSTTDDPGAVDAILESKIFGDILVWHILSIICCTILIILIFLCCCISFRIPRTKQEIEADYVRKQIAKKFRKQLNLIPDGEMDEMDLTKAVERVRFELMTDEEKDAELRAKEKTCHFREDFINEKSQTQDKTSISSDPLNTGTSEEKLMDDDKNNTQFNNKFVTIVNAFNVLRSKKSSKQITV
ncbi:transmembrane inner ear expressed protein-like isoform X1 [Planococcus citri]|uniref:transmembrane inner ear expressed protein-like isoform X1 n=1 Tax=Planococcus citri TaxID=170843 RepID=UPI0031F7C907